MSYENIARRYARAIFEIGKDAKTLDALGREMTSFAQTYAGSPELQNALDNPLVPEASREAILRDVAKALGVSDACVRSLRVLLANRRMMAVADIARQLAWLIDEDGDVLRAHVTSAAALSDGYLARLKAEIERSTGKKVQLTKSEDPSLIAGVVTRIGDQVIDGSARARLATFKGSINIQGSVAES